MGQIIYKGDAYNDGIKNIEMNLAVTGDIPVNGESIETTVDTTTNPERAVISANIPAGLQIENGVIVNDGNAVVQGDEVTTEVVRKDGYINMFGDQGSRFIWKERSVVMGPVNYLTYNQTMAQIKKSIYNSETGWGPWEETTPNDVRTVYAYDLDVFYENVNNDPSKMKVHSDKDYATSSKKYHFEEIIINQPEDTYSLMNILKPSDLYSATGIQTSSTGSINWNNGMEIKIESASLEYYFVKIYGSATNSGTSVASQFIKIPRTAKIIGIFFYCISWSQTSANLLVGIAGFDDFNDETAQLVSFIPLGFVMYNGYPQFSGEGSQHYWTSGSKEYNYAANITKQYTYIDKATYEAAIAEGTT